MDSKPLLTCSVPERFVVADWSPLGADTANVSWRWTDV